MASTVSSRLGAPILLVFLGLGMLAGEDGLGGIEFGDVRASYLVGNIALAVILFDGGMRTRYDTFRTGLWPAVSLATLGVVLTSGIVGVIAAVVLELTLLQGLLLGAIVGSTDAAAVFSVLQSKGVALKQRVASILEIESGSNDPMAIFLTLLLIGVMTAGEASLSVGRMASELVMQFGLGGILGIAGGKMLVAVINRLALAVGLYALLAAAGGMLVFAATTQLGGSGFLAIYLAGLVLGNSRVQASQNILTVHDGLAWLSQIAMFLILGLLVTPSELPAVVKDAGLIALGLMFVARPLAVSLSVLPFGLPWREHAFIGWVGLRGAVPIVLALFPMMAGLDDGRFYFNIAFFVVILSLVAQGWTVAPAARILRLEVPPGTAPVSRLNLDIPSHLEYELYGYSVVPGCYAAGRAVRDLGLPPMAQVSAVSRDGVMLPVSEDVTVRPGDYVYITAVPEEVHNLNRIFDPHIAPKGLEEQRFFGYFSLDGDAPLADIEDVYGLRFADRRPDEITLHDYLARRFHRRPVVGDRVRVSRWEFVVKEIADGRIRKVGFLGAPR
jgi:potassium/hydrogen antiporter